MSGLIGMSLTYESLAPVADPGNMRLSVGTVTFVNSGKLDLDFNETECTCMPTSDSAVRIHAQLNGFEPEAFLHEYRDAGLRPSDLTYEYFASRLPETYLAEIYTEYYHMGTGILLPLTLIEARLIFSGGREVDYSGHISIFALDGLAAVPWPELYKKTIKE